MFTFKPQDYLKFDSPVNQTNEKIHCHNILRRFHKLISKKLLEKNDDLPQEKSALETPIEWNKALSDFWEI